MTAGIGKRYVFSLPGIVKTGSLIFGLVVLIIGLRSHFQSAWVKYDYHKMCGSNAYNAPCPDIAMERFYVAAVIICFILSAIGLLISVFILNPYNKLFWIFDMGYHGLASVTLFIAAILHIVSAIKISDHPFIIGDDHPYDLKVKDVDMFLSTQKIIASLFTIIEAFLYITCAISIRRTRNKILFSEIENPIIG